MAVVDVNDMSVDELRARAKCGTDPDFAVALVERIDRQAATIRDLFADVVRLSMAAGMHDC